MQFFAGQDPILKDSSIIMIVILVTFVGQLSDRLKYFDRQNEILLVLTDRPALFVKTVNKENMSVN